MITVAPEMVKLALAGLFFPRGPVPPKGKRPVCGLMGLSGYLFASEMAKALETAQPDFTAAGLALSGRPTTLEFIEKLKRL